MALHLIIEPSPGHESLVRDSAESALRDAQSYGSITSWAWGEPQGNSEAGRQFPSIEDVVDDIKERVAYVLENAAESLRSP